MNLKFTGPDGKETFVSSTIPGVIIVPDGAELKDAVALTDEQHEKAIARHRKDHPEQPDKLTQEVDALHTKVEQLQKQLDKQK